MLRWRKRYIVVVLSMGSSPRCLQTRGLGLAKAGIWKLNRGLWHEWQDPLFELLPAASPGLEQRKLEFGYSSNLNQGTLDMLTGILTTEPNWPLYNHFQFTNCFHIYHLILGSFHEWRDGYITRWQIIDHDKWSQDKKNVNICWISLEAHYGCTSTSS